MKKVAQMVQEYVSLREEKAEKAKEMKELEAQMEELQSEFIEYFDREECTKATFKGYTVYRSETVVPTVKDWNKFMDYVFKSKAYHLVQRRPSSPAFRELLQMKGVVPGLEPFHKVTANVKKA